MPPKWQPKRVKILAKGAKVAKYFGEDNVGTRQVEVSLKLFDCGHFYMKQSLPGSGACPYQIIFEGKWTEQNDRGFFLKYHVRYTGQTSKKTDLDLAVQALPPNQESMLANCTESDVKNQLNGLVPAIVGEDQWCRVELHAEGIFADDGKARFNEDCPDPPSWKDPTPTGLKPRVFKPACKEDAPPQEPPRAEQRRAGHPPAEQRTEAKHEPVRRGGGTGGIAAPSREEDLRQEKDEEPMGPLLIG